MIYINAADHPPRAETYLAGRRLWAEATEPHETMADVLRELARQIVAAGAHQDAATAVWPRGRQQRPETTIGALADLLGPSTGHVR